MDIASGKFGMIHDGRYEERWQCLVFVFLFFLPFGSKRYFIEPIICRGMNHLFRVTTGGKLNCNGISA